MKPWIVSRRCTMVNILGGPGHRRGVLVLRDGAAEGDPAEIVQPLEHGVEDPAADILEIGIDALRAELVEHGAGVALGLVVEAGVVARLAHRPAAFVLVAGAAHHAGAGKPGELARHLADRAGGGRDERRLARLGLADVPDAVPGGEARHAEHAEMGGRAAPSPDRSCAGPCRHGACGSPSSACRSRCRPWRSAGSSTRPPRRPSRRSAACRARRAACRSAARSCAGACRDRATGSAERTSTWPSPGAGRLTLSWRKQSAVTSPAGRLASTIWMASVMGLSFRRSRRGDSPAGRAAP